MAQSTNRVYEKESYQVTMNLAVGSYAEELYYADSTPVPKGRTEIVMGVAEIKYKEKDGSWHPIDVNIADMKADYAKYRALSEELEKKVEELKLSLNLLTGGEHESGEDTAE